MSLSKTSAPGTFLPPNVKSMLELSIETPTGTYSSWFNWVVSKQLFSALPSWITYNQMGAALKYSSVAHT